MKNWWLTARSNMLLWMCKAVGALPDWFLYGPLRRHIYFILYRIVGYRKAIVRENLSRSFPEKQQAELRSIEKEFYLHLAEVFVDSIDMAGISRKKVLERFTFTNIEEHEQRIKGRDSIVAMSHFGSWEYYSATQLIMSEQVVGVFRILNNKVFDIFYSHLRERFGMTTMQAERIFRFLVRHRADPAPQRNVAVGLIADQVPYWADIRRWYEFLNQPTPFFEGAEQISQRFGMPVYFMHVRKIGVAHYESSFEEIYDGVSPVAEGEITARYAALLEKQIREQPPYWIWSHRRWKRSPGPDDTRPHITLPTL